MKVVETRDASGLDSIRVIDRPDPVPGTGQAVLAMRAFSVNYRDLLVVSGIGRWKPPPGRILLSDGVGVVSAVGNGVSRVRVGDRVCPIFYPDWISGRPDAASMGRALGGAAFDGVLAEHTLFDASSLVHVPAHLSDEEAATLPCAGVTAWNAVAPFTRGTPGRSLVVLGTGGVSMFALQFGRIMEARVIVTSSSDHKLARAKALGADAGINYRTRPDWPGAVRELTDGDGADHVVDTVGGLRQAIAAVRLGGTIAFVGQLDGMTSEVDLVAFMGKSARIEAIDVGSRAAFEEMNGAIDGAKMKPVVDRVFAFDELAEALRYMKEGGHMGKICLRT